MMKHRLWPVFAGILFFFSINPAHADSPVDWQAIAPVEAGFKADIGNRLDAAARTKPFANLHAVVIVRGGKLVLERYYTGKDERRGQPLGTVRFGPEIKHDLRSVSKSIVGLLYGIALADGKVAGLDQPIIGQFRAYKDLAANPDTKRITVYHALTMTMGTKWNEDLPYTDPRNSETAMEMANDRYRYVLEQPIVAQPGSQWNYNGGATEILARLISRGTGQSLLDYARNKLFEPLGISDVEWITGSDGQPIAASGLRMRPRDLAKVGQLILDGGRWGKSSLLPREWLEQSFKPRIRADEHTEYGYHWWLGKMKADKEPWIAAYGNGGQRLFIVPGLQLIVVITAGNYNKPDQWKLPVAVMSKVVIPALSNR